jgi:hypothetical protein
MARTASHSVVSVTRHRCVLTPCDDSLLVHTCGDTADVVDEPPSVSPTATTREGPQPPLRAGKQPRSRSMSCDDAQQPAAGQVGAGQAGSGAGVGVGVVKHRGPRRSNSNGSNTRASEAEVFKRAKVVKDMVTAVFKQKKVFTLFGGPGYADDIRQGLLRRGWIERPPPRETDAYVLDPPPPHTHTHTHSHTLTHTSSLS